MEAARPATADDVTALVALATAARDEVAGLRGGDIWRVKEARQDPLEPALAAAVADAGAQVVVGTVDGVVVGYATTTVESLADGRTLAVLSDLYVDPEARSVGIGEAMMELVLQWCRERGCTGIDSIALPGARDTKNFFEESGFTARALTMHHKL